MSWQQQSKSTPLFDAHQKISTLRKHGSFSEGRNLMNRNPTKRAAAYAAFAFALVFIIGVWLIPVIPAFFDYLIPRVSGPLSYCASLQCQEQTAILHDRTALRPGYIEVQRSIATSLDEPQIVTVAICGEEVPDCQAGVVANSYTKSEPSEPQGKLLVGARIQTTLKGGMPGKIEALTPKVQPIMQSLDAGFWLWSVDPSSAGNYDLILTVTPLEGASDSPLVASLSARKLK